MGGCSASELESSPSLPSEVPSPEDVSLEGEAARGPGLPRTAFAGESSLTAWGLPLCQGSPAPAPFSLGSEPKEAGADLPLRPADPGLEDETGKSSSAGTATWHQHETMLGNSKLRYSHAMVDAFHLNSEYWELGGRPMQQIEYQGLRGDERETAFASGLSSVACVRMLQQSTAPLS